MQNKDCPQVNEKNSGFGMLRLVPFIEAAGKLVAQGLQEIILIKAYQAEHELLTPDGQLNILVHDLTARIHGADDLVGPALHFKRDYGIIGDHNGPYIEIMGGNGCEHEAAG